ncbi:hypothetical protein NPIL_275551 [Nephila pilipes]|uniref:Uncharacterized protein n=1 Tax=Nephila pilipes TaxID=299642 RepID=A0A8X6QPF2_NEPPI|nr:hypothetical protein NPIL_275551 [Nephila pilipes]
MYSGKLRRCKTGCKSVCALGAQRQTQWFSAKATTCQVTQFISDSKELTSITTNRPGQSLSSLSIQLNCHHFWPKKATSTYVHHKPERKDGEVQTLQFNVVIISGRSEKRSGQTVPWWEEMPGI